MFPCRKTRAPIEAHDLLWVDAHRPPRRNDWCASTPLPNRSSQLQGRPDVLPNLEIMLATRTFAVVLEPDAQDGGFTAIVPALPGVITEGDSAEEALENARDAIRLCLEHLAEQGQMIPQGDDGVRLERVEIAVAEGLSPSGTPGPNTAHEPAHKQARDA